MTLPIQGYTVLVAAIRSAPHSFTFAGVNYATLKDKLVVMPILPEDFSRPQVVEFNSKGQPNVRHVPNIIPSDLSTQFCVTVPGASYFFAVRHLRGSLADHCCIPVLHVALTFAAIGAALAFRAAVGESIAV
jgi:hypothetical protein